MTTYSIYVASNGNDENDGTLERPFQTLERARNYVLEMQQALSYDLEVNLRQGTYYLEAPFSLTASDKPYREQKLTLKAYENEEVTLSGGQRLKGTWRKHNEKIWCIDLPESFQMTCHEVFVNGKRQTCARLPKTGYYSKVSEQTTPWPHQSFYYDQETFPDEKIKSIKGATLHIFPGTYWGNLQWKVTAIDSKTHQISLGKGGYQINDIMQGVEATGIDARSKFFVENLFEALEMPGEWYIDKENRILYLIPEEGINLAEANVEVAQLQRLVELRGTMENPICNVSIEGLRFAHTAPTYLEDYEAPSLGDWTIHRGGAIFVEGACQCQIKECYLDQVGGNGIFINNYNEQIEIISNVIEGAGDSGICIVGNKQKTIGSQKCYPSHITVHNNEITAIGKHGKQTAGVFVSVSEKNIISNNHIYEVPRAAICINDGTWGGHRIMNNSIHDTVKETGDHGPFNSWGRDRFWCLEQSHGPASHGSGNVLLDAKNTTMLHHNYFEDYKGWGIDLDDGSSNYHISDNLCVGIGIKLREGNYRTIENNIFIHCANPPGFHIGYEGNQDVFRRNIVVMDTKYDNPEIDIDFEKNMAGGAIYELIGPPMQGKWLQEIDYNVFYNDLNAFRAIVHERPLGSHTQDYDLETWQQKGFDQHSIYGDPAFYSIENKDFRLKENSPAFEVGFIPFALDQFGPDKSFKNRYYR